MLTIHHGVLEWDGQYFPYLADTAWTLLQRLTREEILFYLDKRRSQGFNAVQVSAISELDGQRTPTPEGLLPFVGGNVRKPCRAYFDKLLCGGCLRRPGHGADPAALLGGCL